MKNTEKNTRQKLRSYGKPMRSVQKLKMCVGKQGRERLLKVI